MKRLFMFLAVCVLLAAGKSWAAAPAERAGYAALFDEVCIIVETNFCDPAKIRDEFPAFREKARNDLAGVSGPADFSGLVNGMLRQLHTSHTYYLTPADVEYYQLSAVFFRIPEIAALFGHQEIRCPGVGIMTEQIDGRHFIVAVLPGSAAERAGLLRGDEIVSADGKAFAPVGSFEDRIARDVVLQIRRERSGETRPVTVVPALVNPGEELQEAQENSARLIEREGKRVGYIHIYSYAGMEYHQELLSAITWGGLKDADALIIDLRYGLGGASPSYLNIFNPRIPVLRMTDREGNTRTFDAQWRKPAVYLVNHATRSGKELLAFGARKYNLATVIGERTAGATTAGRLFPLSSGDLLYLAVHTSEIDGVNLEGVGVSPDITVPADVRYSAGKDVQLETAVGYLVEKLQGKQDMQAR